MNKKKAVLLNSGVGAGVSICSIFISFFSRTIFIRYLGEQYLGLNGLFTSILSMLSLAELGIGTSIVYFLYKPLANKDYQQAGILLALYKKVYMIIGAIVLILGLCVYPFIPNLINGAVHLGPVKLYYLMFLFNSVSSYFFAYNRSVLIANQEGYIVSLNDFAFKVVLQIAQIIVLVLTQNFFGYLIAQICSTIASNLVLSKLVNTKYPQIIDKRIKGRISDELATKMKKNVFGNFANKLGYVVVNGIDNIFLSVFVSISAVGLYSNYLMIITSVQSVLLSVSNAVTATIGNIAVSGSESQGLSVFKKHQFVNATLGIFSSTMMYSGVDGFIKLWVGEKYVFAPIITIVIVLNYFVNRLRNSGKVFIEAYGLAWQQRFKPFIEAGLNFAFSLLFVIVLDLGVVGVILSTLVTSLFFATVYEAVIVFKYAFNLNVRYFFEMYFRHCLCFMACIILTTIVKVMLLSSGIQTWIELVYSLLISFVVTTGVYLIFYGKDENFKFLLKTVVELGEKHGRALS